MGMMMGGMGMMGGLASAEQTESAPFYVMTVVETKLPVNNAQLRALQNNRPIEIETKWGKSVLQPEPGIDIIVMKSGDKKPFPSVMKRFLDRKKEAEKDGETTVDLLLDYETNPQAGMVVLRRSSSKSRNSGLQGGLGFQERTLEISLVISFAVVMRDCTGS